jgi:hypothetical protein
MARKMTFEAAPTKGYVWARTPGIRWIGMGKTEQAARADLNKQIRRSKKG